MRYKVPFVNYPEHYRRIWDETVGAFESGLATGDLIMRDQMRQFEDHIASFCGVKHAVGVNSGTDALVLSVRAAGIRPGDEVLTVAHTFVATIAAIVQNGATPKLIDVAEDMNMDVEQIEQAITSKTKAIIPVHLNGRLCDMETLAAIAEDNDLIIIEDAAQALGARFKGKEAGSFGVSGCFSFYPAKMLGAAGDGGLVTTNSEQFAEQLRLFRDHCYERATGFILGYGYNSRLDNLQAAILNAKLNHLPEWIERRREIASLYHDGLSDVGHIALPPAPSSSGYYDVYQNYVIKAEERDALIKHLAESGIEVLVSWPIPLHFHKALGLSHFKLPETERISKQVVSLPMYPELSDDQVQYTIDAIKAFYNL